MKEIDNISNLTDRDSVSLEKIKLPGYPSYPSIEDIYYKYYHEKNINPEEILKTKEIFGNEKIRSSNEKDFNDDVSGNDLDIPGSELDDIQESVGSEDEENNYYSLGGDDHNDLEENNGE
jgi:hypothetical protein